MTWPGADPQHFLGQLAPLVAAPARSVVACDYDGTLAPVVPDPLQARPSPGAVDALMALSALVGRLAVVTGRPADVAVRLGGLDMVPRLVVLGLYGAQRWEAGRLTGAAAVPGLAPALAEVRSLLAASGPATAGTWIEDKGGAFALHVRRAADPAAAMAALRDRLARIADRAGLLLEPGRLVLELRAPGSDKGTALRSLVDELGEEPSGVLYAGDDLGDRPAFAAVRALRAEGVPAWSVAASNAETPEVAADADLVVDGPAGVVRLLTAIAAALG